MALTVLRRAAAGPKGARAGRSQLNLTDEELGAAADLVLEHPWMGGKKGAANLVHDEKAWVGATSYDNIKHMVASIFGTELSQRRATNRKPKPFELPIPQGLNEVWGSDLFELPVWGKKFHICDFLDVHNQEYLEIRAIEGTADSEFVSSCFETACERRDGCPPKVCTKTDRGSQYLGAFAAALEGRTEHVRIPPGSPWFNGESERGHRDLRALLYAELSRVKRPAEGRELAAVQKACERVRQIVNEEISKPSLGNVTPREVALGIAEDVKNRNQEYVKKQREARSQRAADPRSLRDRLWGLLQPDRLETRHILRFLRLRSRDYEFMKG